MDFLLGRHGTAKAGIQSYDRIINRLKNEAKKQKFSVDKGELLAELAANRVRVEEVLKGGPEASTDPEYFNDLQSAYQMVRGSDHLNDWLAAAEEVARQHDLPMDAVYNDLHELDSGTLGNTKFSQHQLPGGENYRELLLTLPSPRSEPIQLDPGDFQLKVLDDRMFPYTGQRDVQVYYKGKTYIRRTATRSSDASTRTAS